ncbi:MAG: hypothetical protein K0B14_16840 [Anaerolineaceae bacterium]|nr:hypothetical protein [Anaerolineaceae bacterium]
MPVSEGWYRFALFTGIEMVHGQNYNNFIPSRLRNHIYEITNSHIYKFSHLRIFTLAPAIASLCGMAIDYDLTSQARQIISPATLAPAFVPLKAASSTVLCGMASDNKFSTQA